MSTLQDLFEEYRGVDFCDLGNRKLEVLGNALKKLPKEEITTIEDGKRFLVLLRNFRETLAENAKLNGENYPNLLKSILTVGEDGLYSDSLRFIFELIQNVDDCDFAQPDDCKLDMRFDFEHGEIILTYNEVGFTPFNVFSITGIAEAAKNISATKDEIGEKGIGFKSVFGVADRVLIRSGWFSFELYKDNFTIPIAAYKDDSYCSGTQMTLYVPGRAEEIYRKIKEKYCRKEALFSKNPLLFLRKLTYLKLYFDTWRSMEFSVSRSAIPNTGEITREDNVNVSVKLRDQVNGVDRETIEKIACTRYTYPVIYSRSDCQSRYGENTAVGSDGGKPMVLQAVVPCAEDVQKVGNGALYSFLPTQLAFTVPIVCHAPFKLDSSREFVDPQSPYAADGNPWFKSTCIYLSELMDYVLSDWAKTSKQDILYYLPVKGGSLFAENNGKEECLISQSCFKSDHYLKLPLFETVEGDLKPASEVFCFDQKEGINDPIKVADLLGLPKALFLAPEKVSPGKFGITMEQDVYARLFRRAIMNRQTTVDALEYLDSVGYEYPENQFPRNEEIQFDVVQLEHIMKHKPIVEIMTRIATDAIKKGQRPLFSVSCTEMDTVASIFQGEYDLSETPKAVNRYLGYCENACVCLNIAEDQFLPCHNGLVLSKGNPLSSLAEFCDRIDKAGTFTIRIKLREATNRIEECIRNDSGTADDFIKDIRNIRLTIKESLGKTGYKNYLNLILQSGTDRMRFIQELLQNADDCTYPQDRIPSFSFQQHSKKIVTEYNELGFTKENIRSITAIGESTKNRIINDDLQNGEKGVGFKTVFAIASEVNIHSGDYHFSLSADEPTIPRLINGVKEPVEGTRMEITLKDQSPILSMDATNILDLCLCLRRIRKLNFNGHKVSITDTDSQRILTIDNRSHVFSKYVHPFTISDKNALAERENGSRKISPHRVITCYVPEKMSRDGFPLYNGFPTKHWFRIPMAIDAPFALTTSRETIATDCISWNNIIKEEMYHAILEVIHARKETDRSNVLRFIRVRYRLYGFTRSEYVNEISDENYLNDYNYLDRLRTEKIIPTLNKSVFVSATDQTAFRYPDVAMILLKKISSTGYNEVSLSSVIDSDLGDASKEKRERLDTILTALSCKNAPFGIVFPLLKNHAETFVDQEDFRNSLYDYLQNTPDDYQESLQSLKIIPVYGKEGGTQYISWEEDGIFVKKDAFSSGETYWVLDEKLLPKATCEKILGVNINELNPEYERARYQQMITGIVTGSAMPEIYDSLMDEYKKGELQKNACLGVLLNYKDVIPLKNELGKIDDMELFTCDQPYGYFDVEMLQCITVHPECAEFAKYIGCRPLSDIYYSDLRYDKPLTAADIEALQDDYFEHSEEILRGFYLDGYISDGLLSEYGLEYIAMDRLDNRSMELEFPEEPVRDRYRLTQSIRPLLNNPITIFSEKVERTVQKGRRSNGITFDLNGDEVRKSTLQRYTPEGESKIAFCQMCLKPKNYMFMEVNSLELKPEHYFPQMRVALCLECSKFFEAIRGKDSFREEYLNEIRRADPYVNENIEIPIGQQHSLTFTATHLAEIQEILKWRQK